MSRGALYMQAIRGPLVLITLGVLCAIHQAGILSFSRTWPLILIVIGLVKLAERLLLPPGYVNACRAAGKAPPRDGPAQYNQAPYTYSPPPPPPPAGAPKP